MLGPCLVLVALPAAACANLVEGSSVQFDPGFAYYQNRSADSVAREIEANGYRVVRYIVTNDGAIRDDLIEAFHRRKMSVWYQTFGNGFYGDAPGALPSGWQKWKPVFLGQDLNEGYTFLSMSNAEYRRWKTAQILAVLAKHKFDGVEIAEPFQMGWGGPEKGLYGDVCDAALAAFRNQTGYDAPPDFRNAASPSWYKTDRARYRAWTDFRVDQVNSYLKELRDGVKAKFPSKPFSVWMLANTTGVPGRDPADVIREWQGIDAVSMAKTVRPDLVCFQTNWPDWSNPDLPGDYPNQYRPFFEPLKKAFPKLPIIFQADTGSLKEMRRDRRWIEAFESTCKKLGAGSTYYMYDISRWQYTEPPAAKKVEVSGNRVTVVFQKRIDAHLATSGDRLVLRPAAKLRSIKVDGNLLICEYDRLLEGTEYTLRMTRVSDDKSRRLYNDYPALEANIEVRFRR